MKTNTIYNQDCLEFLARVADDSVQHVNCDPPYNIGIADWDCFASEDNYLAWCGKWIAECTRVLKPSGMLSVWGTQKTDLFFRLKLEVLNQIPGLVGRYPIHWSYNWGGRTKKNFPHKMETAWCYSKGEEFLFNGDAVRVERKMKRNIRTGEAFTEGTVPTTIWQGNLATVSKESQESKWHPTVKPQFVLQRMVLAYSNPGDLVMDCFSGSGSTLLACKATGRNFIGCELDKDYFDKSLYRIENSATKQIELIAA